MQKCSRGFSLVETLVAVAILSLLSLAATSLLSGIVSSERHNRAITEVESQGNYALYQITQSARNATAILTPSGTATTSTAQFTSAISAENPTIITLANGVVLIKRGSAATTTLTSSNVTGTGLSFQNLTASSTKGTLRVAMTLSYTKLMARSTLSFAQTFYTSVTLR